MTNRHERLQNLLRDRRAKGSKLTSENQSVDVFISTGSIGNKSEVTRCQCAIRRTSET